MLYLFIYGLHGWTINKIKSNQLDDLNPLIRGFSTRQMWTAVQCFFFLQLIFRPLIAQLDWPHRNLSSPFNLGLLQNRAGGTNHNDTKRERERFDECYPSHVWMHGFLSIPLVQRFLSLGNTIEIVLKITPSEIKINP